MSFLAELFIFLLAAIIVVPICKRLGLSSVIGYLAAGVVIGPDVLGIIGDAVELLHFAEIGVVLLLFIIGLELQPKRLWVMRRPVFLLGPLQLLASTLGLMLALMVLFSLPFLTAALLGFSLALSSTAFVLQLLGEQKKLNDPHGRAAFGVLLLQDVAVIPVIALLSVAGSIGNSSAFDPVVLGLVVVGLIVARYSLKPLLRIVAATGIHELFSAASLAIVTGSALGMQYAGLSMGLGAFIAGMMVADSEYRHQLETDVMPFKGLLLGLFFIAVGMSADLDLVFDSPLLILGLALGLIGIKTLVLWPIARWYGLSNIEALKTAAVLSQGGEFAFVLLTVALSASLVSEDLVAMTVLIVTVSMVTTPFLLNLINRVSGISKVDRPYDDMDSEAKTILIAGFGRFGQIVARILSMKGIPFTALDANPGQVDFVRQFGNEVFYGDARRLDLLKTAHIAEAKLLVIAVEDMDASIKIATMVRETYPNLQIMARARNRQHELSFREIGVDYVIRETLLSSLALARELLERLGHTADSAASTIDLFQAHDAQSLDKQSAVFHDENAFLQTSREAAEELKSLFQEDHEQDKDLKDL